MLQPQQLDLKGFRLNLTGWRGRDILLEAVFKKADGSAVNLSDQDAILKLYAPDGNLQWTWTTSPGDHEDEAGGVSELSVPAAVSADQTGVRAHTLKYEIYLRQLVTGFSQVYFYGDLVFEPGPAAT